MSSNSKCQIPRKMYKVDILEIIRAKFHQNRFSCLGCSADTHRQTDRHTHAHTHTIGSIATYSVKMTEYKKGKHFWSNYSCKRDNSLQKCIVVGKINLSQVLGAIEMIWALREIWTLYFISQLNKWHNLASWNKDLCSQSKEHCKQRGASYMILVLAVGLSLNAVNTAVAFQ